MKDKMNEYHRHKNYHLSQGYFFFVFLEPFGVKTASGAFSPFFLSQKKWILGGTKYLPA